MQIWPAVQIRSGMCVRLSQGDYDRETVYGESPADMAVRWTNDGAFGLHLVDLDGARDGTSGNFDSIVKVAQQVNVPLMLGGGIRTEEKIQKYLEIGIDRLVVGTQALKDPQWAIQMATRYPQKIMLGLDARSGYLASDGWQQTTQVSAVDFAQQMATHPIAGIIFTDIAKDGTLGGPNFEAQQQLRGAVSVPVIASGGIATVNDVTKLAALKLDGCVIGRALYEGRLTLADSFQAAWQGVALASNPSTCDSSAAATQPQLPASNRPSGASTP